MKKYLLILSALMLTAVGASAQTPYEFHAEDWIQNPDRTTASSLVYNDDNTIAVTSSGSNNISLGNNWTYASGTTGITTSGYTITSDQTYFVIVGSDLDTTTSGYSYLWWLNGFNDGSQIAPTSVVTLTSDDANGQVLFAWDISSYVTAGTDGNITLNGWTCFGLTSTATDNKSTISYIGFCKPSEATSSFTIPENTYVHACAANESVWSTTATLADSYHLRIDTWATQSDEKMSVPFMEYYADGDAYLPDATISHHQLTGLTPGVYEVSMDIRIIDFAKDGDDNAKIGAGTTFNANGVSEDILTGSDGTEDEYGDGNNDEVYGTYTLTCVVDEAGTLDISLDVKDATYSWIMWKNLKVKLLETATISWEMTDAGWGTLILPFAVAADDVPEDLTIYTCDGTETSEETGTTTVTVTEVTTGIAANTPYLVKGNVEQDTDYTFSGTPVEATGTLTAGLLTGTFEDMDYSALVAAAGTGTVYLLQNQTDVDGVAFYPVTDASTEATLTANHCYLTLSSTSPVRGFISFPNTDDVATGIVAVESDDLIADDAIYDLSGRRVAKAVKGVYIQNGKKVLVK